MKKIISLFQRNYNGDRLVFDKVVPGAEWVLAGEGLATRKYDGTCCLIRDGKLYKRYDAKHGKNPPIEFEPAQDSDPNTGHWPGWLPIGEGPEDARHREALKALGPIIVDGTYELCGPKVNGNPELLAAHKLIRHGDEILTNAPRAFDALQDYLRDLDIEGIVWHHPDGRMVKIKRRDFGFRRQVKKDAA